VSHGPTTSTPVQTRIGARHGDPTSRGHGANERSIYVQHKIYTAEGTVKQATGIGGCSATPHKTVSQHHEQRIERLIGRLPEKLQTIIRWPARAPLGPGTGWPTVHRRRLPQHPPRVRDLDAAGRADASGRGYPAHTESARSVPGLDRAASASLVRWLGCRQQNTGVDTAFIIYRWPG